MRRAVGFSEDQLPARTDAIIWWMSNPLTSHPSYYLAIAGEQVGPLSEEDVLNRIEQGELDKETLVWSEGMEEWAPLTALAVFEAAFRMLVVNQNAAAHHLGDDSRIVDLKQLQKEAATQKRSQNPHPRKEKMERIAPVFRDAEARVSDEPFVQGRIKSVSMGLAVLAVCTLGYFYFGASSEDPTNGSKYKNKNGNKNEARQLRLSKAQSELLTNNEASLEEMKKLVAENPNDEVGKQAVQALIDYYRTAQKYTEAGKILMQTKQPAEAAKMFMQDPNSKAAAEDAYFQAFQTVVDPALKRSFLRENIALLIGPLAQPEKALERIRLFVTTFPSEPHPYHYYLQSTDERINDIFSRISFHFVQGLIGFFETELPQITLINRPLVEVKKSKMQEYKIVGSYRGEVLLNKDRLQNIYFTFWLDGDRWVLVDTNITAERKRWAQGERAKLKDVTASGEATLRYLEQVFHTQFPNAALHEKIEPSSPAAKSKKEDGFQ